MTRPKSILEGVGTLVDKWLGIEQTGQAPYYRHITSAQKVSERGTRITGTTNFLRACHDQIHANWLASKDHYAKPSLQNWRWDPRPDIASNNESDEVQFERSVVRAITENWSNQMPVASGLIGPATHTHNNVDLVYRKNDTTYSFIELKVASNNPLYAAIEILQYGLLFIWSKTNQEALGYSLKTHPLLAATNLIFCVLAPADYYRGYDFSELNRALNEGLGDFGKQTGLTLAFEFTVLGDSYRQDATPTEIRSAINNRQRIYC